MQKFIFIVFLLPLFFTNCSSFRNGTKSHSKEPLVLISTSLGDIKIKLYNETPVHRDNFIKLVSQHFYDSTLFHRVIQGFMIQGGDPDSKKAAPGVLLGNGEIGYTLPAEFNPKLFHKRGVLAAARMGDDVNPKKESSACQFYIVQGRVFSQTDLDGYEAKINNPVKQKMFSDFINKKENRELKEKYTLFQMNNNTDSLQKISIQIRTIIEQEFAKTNPFKFSEEQRTAYTSIGGVPHLDGNYTVFGEVVEGMDVVDKIAALKVNSVSRPDNDIKMSIKIIRN